ncbi:hypothetical protein GYMLUDRAFT_253682 [Collybiopsis luxurians FD-317 M1]|nr:hypothetical protein GYMLUDRAFT_253682 [Collybiopsis luxurians FD-317 M1]
MRKQAIKLACEEVAEEVINLQMFHDDNNMDNVLVTVKNKQVVAARIVDYGGESVFHTKKSISKEVVIAYCEKEALQWWK